jgi:hypothetical protein
MYHHAGAFDAPIAKDHLLYMKHSKFTPKNALLSGPGFPVIPVRPFCLLIRMSMPLLITWC